MGNKRLGRRRELSGEMIRCDLKVRIVQASSAVIQGLVADDDGADPWARNGGEVIVYINPPSTAFRDPHVIGTGRIYEDRIEIDLVLAPARMADLLDGLPADESGQLHFQTRPVTKSAFRIEAVVRG